MKKTIAVSSNITSTCSSSSSSLSVANDSYVTLHQNESACTVCDDDEKTELHLYNQHNKNVFDNNNRNTTIVKRISNDAGTSNKKKYIICPPYDDNDIRSHTHGIVTDRNDNLSSLKRIDNEVLLNMHAQQQQLQKQFKSCNHVDKTALFFSSSSASNVATNNATTITINSNNILLSSNINSIRKTNRTGIIVESSMYHSDSSNLYHKERPVRVHCIVHALQKQRQQPLQELQYCNNNENSSNDEDQCLWDRCIVLYYDNGNSNVHDRMNYIYHSISLQSKTNNHSKPIDIDSVLVQVHHSGYIDRLNKLSKKVNANKDNHSLIQQQKRKEQIEYLLDSESSQYESIYLTKESIQCAKHVVLLVCQLIDNVLSNQLDNGFAICRPPGHHADVSMAGGYCIYNNVAAAAQYALHHYPDSIQKVMIIDWDVHHGNGTQSIFYNQSNVLYFSVHRWDNGTYYPYLKSSGPNYVGSDNGLGYNINVAWATSQSGGTSNTTSTSTLVNNNMSIMPGDKEYYAVWDCLLLPITQEYKPDLILISAGFDAADGDTVGNCHVTPQCYANLTKSLMQLTHRSNQKRFSNEQEEHYSERYIPIVLTLEGGYARNVLSQCVCSVIETLLDGSIGPPICTSIPKNELQREIRTMKPEVSDLDNINPIYAANIHSTIQAHRPYWKCLQQTT